MQDNKYSYQKSVHLILNRYSQSYHVICDTCKTFIRVKKKPPHTNSKLNKLEQMLIRSGKTVQSNNNTSSPSVEQEENTRPFSPANCTNGIIVATVLVGTRMLYMQYGGPQYFQKNTSWIRKETISKNSKLMLAA